MSSGWWTKRLTGQAPMPQPSQMPAQQPQTAPVAPNAPADPNGQVHVSEAAQSWQGTHEQRQQTGRCQKCGGANYWEIPSRGTYVPKCFDCGSTVFVQYGSEQGTGGSQQKVNPNAAEYGGHARQPKGFYTGAHTDQIIARVGGNE